MLKLEMELPVLLSCTLLSFPVGPADKQGGRDPKRGQAIRRGGSWKSYYHQGIKGG